MIKDSSTCNHKTIPIFIPGIACPYHCIYCNQQVISGHSGLPSNEEFHATVQQYLTTMTARDTVEIAFFGGTFTGLPLQEQERLLRQAAQYLENGSVQALRCSTHPLYINGQILSLLRRYGMSTVELGVQSMDDEVLRQVGRGYTHTQVQQAAAEIKVAGMHLGMQMMVGLPHDSKEKSLATARSIIACGADNTRIYPLLVVQHTPLATLYREGKYTPLTLQQAVDWVKEPLRTFQEHEVTVLRVGLHPTEGFIRGTDYLAGPFHVSFKELVQTAIWREVLEIYLQKNPHLVGTSPQRNLSLQVSPAQVNSAVGYKAENKKWLLQYFRKVRVLADTAMHHYQFSAQVETV